MFLNLISCIYLSQNGCQVRYTDNGCLGAPSSNFKVVFQDCCNPTFVKEVQKGADFSPFIHIRKLCELISVVHLNGSGRRNEWKDVPDQS